MSVLSSAHYREIGRSLQRASTLLQRDSIVRYRESQTKEKKHKTKTKSQLKNAFSTGSGDCSRSSTCGPDSSNGGELVDGPAVVGLLRRRFVVRFVRSRGRYREDDRRLLLRRRRCRCLPLPALVERGLHHRRRGVDGQLRLDYQTAMVGPVWVHYIYFIFILIFLLVLLYLFYLF